MDFKDINGILAYHQKMLADSERVEAFKRALGAVISDGDVVLDIGAGSGVLSFLALQAGAGQVYAIDSGDAIEFARVLLPANDPDQRIQLIKGPSWEVALPEQADVIVSETLWNMGVGEGLLRSVIDARERSLRDGGQIVPAAFEVIVAPIEASRQYDQFSVWRTGAYGLDLSAVRQFATNNVFARQLDSDDQLAGGQPLARVTTLDVSSPDVTGDAIFRVDRAGVVHGLGGWFRAELADGVELTNAPPNRAQSWAHAFLPLEQPLEVKRGDELHARVSATQSDDVLSWDVSRIEGPARAGSLRQSTFFGLPIGSEHVSGPPAKTPSAPHGRSSDRAG